MNKILTGVHSVAIRTLLEHPNTAEHHQMHVHPDEALHAIPSSWQILKPGSWELCGEGHMHVSVAQ